MAAVTNGCELRGLKEYKCIGLTVPKAGVRAWVSRGHDQGVRRAAFLWGESVLWPWAAWRGHLGSWARDRVLHLESHQCQVEVFPVTTSEVSFCLLVAIPVITGGHWTIQGTVP